MAATATFCHTLPWWPRNPSLPSLSLPFFSSSQLKLTTLSPLSFSFTSLSHNVFSKDFQSISAIQRPVRGSIICMARRYGSNRRKRKIMSRKNGGDQQKKKKRRRKNNSKRKDKFKIIKLVSKVGTGYAYSKKKGKNLKDKLEIKKYDPIAKCHVLFKEMK